MKHKMSEDNVEMEVNETQSQIINITIQETKPIVNVSEEKLPETFRISIQTLNFLKSLLQIISQRNSFKIEEFKIVGTFYETLLSIEGETVSGDFIQGLLNILQTLLKRGAFQINELQIISELYSSISNVL
tara:strand:- start:1273 stop:1665 length:393 start_codon:yes stop_codon:yes gene_type:complete